jgi:hypothetical protein
MDISDNFFKVFLALNYNLLQEKRQAFACLTIGLIVRRRRWRVLIIARRIAVSSYHRMVTIITSGMMMRRAYASQE